MNSPDIAHPPVVHRSRWKTWLIGFVLLGASVAAYQKWFAAPPAAPQGRQQFFPRGLSVPVRAVAATRGNIDVEIKALGTVTPLNTVTVRSRVDGELVRVNFTEGQIVKAGQLLAEIDSRPFETQIARRRLKPRAAPRAARFEC